MKDEQRKEKTNIKKRNEGKIFFAILWSLLGFLFDGILDQLALMIIWFVIWIFVAVPILLIELRNKLRSDNS